MTQIPALSGGGATSANSGPDRLVMTSPPALPTNPVSEQTRAYVNNLLTITNPKTQFTSHRAHDTLIVPDPVRSLPRRHRYQPCTTNPVLRLPIVNIRKSLPVEGLVSHATNPTRPHRQPC